VSVYVDSGVLVKLYVRERNSDIAARSVRHHTWVPLNGLMELELRNTFQMLEARNVLSDAQRAAAEHFLELDCVEGRLHRTALNWTEILHHSIALSRGFTTRTLARSLDILHVATALHQRCSLFITADNRQASFARLCGLQVEHLS